MCKEFFYAWAALHRIDLEGEAPLRIAIQGDPGSNSHLAVQSMLGEQDLVPCSVSAEVFERLNTGQADAAVLPIENSLHGAVADHYDLLLEHDVRVVAEAELRIRHSLIAANGTAKGNIRRVLSHPVALSQCRRFFREHPEVQAVPFYDTAGSVKEVVSHGMGDAAAIAAPYAAQVYGGTILEDGLEDDPKNFTRFFLLCRRSGEQELRALQNRVVAGQTTQKLTLAFAIPHRPGSLVGVLQKLAACGADLTHIESRPVPGQPWRYNFFADMRLAPLVEEAFVMEAIRPDCEMVRILGSYPAAASSGAEAAFTNTAH